MNGHKITNQEGLHFLTFTVVGWIDVFTRERYAKIIIESLKYCQEHKGLRLHAYVIMSNHMHIIASTKEGFKLSNVIRDFKSFTSKAIIKDIIDFKKESRKKWMLKLFKDYGKSNKRNVKFQFWKQDNKPTELISPKWINIRINYIHLNPVRAGIVSKEEDYKYSSAKNYLEQESEIKVELICIVNEIS